jgi:hypothetical protein
MFASNGDNKKSGGSVSNWFFSLRRQPKKQKSLDSSKLLQKSCVDLTAAGSGSSEQDLLFRTKPSKLKLNNKSSNSNTNNNNTDDASSSSNSCTNCCCKFSSKNSSPSPIDDIEQCDQLRRVLITSEENYSRAAECHEEDDEDEDIVDVHRASTLPRKKPTTNNFSSNILLYNKKEEFTRTTRTVTTKIVTKAPISGHETIASTRTVNHQRIGSILHENGQLVNGRRMHLTKNRDGLIFDECGRLLYADSHDESSSSLTPISVFDDTIEFIDSSTQNSDIQNRANMQQQHKCSNNSSNSNNISSNVSGSKLTLSSSLMSSCKSEWDYNKQVIFPYQVGGGEKWVGV